MTSSPEVIVGIDLGTTFSLVAFCDERGPQVIRDENGDGRVPSVVHFAPDGRATIGWQARAHAVEHPLDTVYSVKRLMGIGVAELAKELPFLSYHVGKRQNVETSKRQNVETSKRQNVETPGSRSVETSEARFVETPKNLNLETDDSGAARDVAAVNINGEWLTPQEISALILRDLKARAEQHFGRPIRKAVITVPAYFDDSQRQATRDAGRIAGLEVVRIVNEPTAAALAYGLGARLETSKRQNVETSKPEGANTPNSTDESPPGIGGNAMSLPIGDKSKCTGTAESPGDSAAPSTSETGIRERSTGHWALGTGHWNPVTGNSETGISRSDPQTPAAAQTSVIAVYDLGGGTFDVSILRLEDGVFEVLGTHGDTHLGGDDFDRRIITLAQREVERQFGVHIDAPGTRQALRLLAEQVKIRLSMDAAATIELDLGNDRIYRRTIPREEFEAAIAPDIERTIDACKKALAAAKLNREHIERIVLVGGSSRIPLVRRRVAEFFGRPPYTALNPDEVVALGAAVQAQILAGGRRDLLLLDVTPLALGIETMGGAMGKLILANTRVPCRASEQFTTFVDGQANVKINVLQGERELAADCRSLGQFELRSIPPMPAGIPKIEVTFLIDANGILSVTAREQRSGTEAQIQVIPAHGLTADEVKRMTADAYRFARKDMTAHRLIDLRNQVEFDTHKAEQMLAKVGDRLPATEREVIEEGIRVLRRLATTTGDADKIHLALEQFDKQTVRLAELAVAQALRHEWADAEQRAPSSREADSPG